MGDSATSDFEIQGVKGSAALSCETTERHENEDHGCPEYYDHPLFEGATEYSGYPSCDLVYWSENQQVRESEVVIEFRWLTGCQASELESICGQYRRYYERDHEFGQWDPHSSVSLASPSGACRFEANGGQHAEAHYSVTYAQRQGGSEAACDALGALTLLGGYEQTTN